MKSVRKVHGRSFLRIPFRTPWTNIVLFFALILSACDVGPSSDTPEQQKPIQQGPHAPWPNAPGADVTGPSSNAQQTVWRVNRENQYALNVILFNPTDFTVDESLTTQVSDMMLYIQEWFEKQMDLQGFGKKTFGLMTNKQGNVRVLVVQGTRPSSYYNGNPGKIASEVHAYLRAHPDAKSSEHYMVLGKAGSRVPFVGWGKFGFATTKNFALTPTNKYLGDFRLMTTHFLGGIMHELAHGLNVPHSAARNSQRPKVSLMSYGNHTYQNGNTIDQVYLNKYTAAILDSAQVFNTRDKQFYQQRPAVSLEGYSIQKDAARQATILRGTLKSNVPADYLYAAHQGADGGSDYGMVPFTTELQPTDVPDEYSFNMEMPWSDLFNGYQDDKKSEVNLAIGVITQTGYRIGLKSYNYHITNRIPDSDIEQSVTRFRLSDRSSWTASANSRGYGDDVSAAYMLDGDKSTMWHSAWYYDIASRGSHVITMDMSEPRQINGVYIYSMQSSLRSFNYNPKHIVVETSIDDSTWIRRKEFRVDAVHDAKEITVPFDLPVNARYFRLSIDEVYTKHSEKNLIINEVDVLL